MNKKQTIRLNENQLRRIVKESAKRVLKESQYDDLSNDEWDYMYREANDMPQYDLLGLYGYTIWKMKPNGRSLEKQVEESDFKERTNSKQKALKKSYLTTDELSEHEDEINEVIFERRMNIVIEELEKGNTTKQASKKASIKINDIYKWLEKGLDGDGYFEEFADVYKKEYLIPIEKAYEEGIKEGVNEKNIIKAMKRHEFIVNDDVKYLKQLDLFPKPEDVVVDLENDLNLNLDEMISN